MLTVLRIPTTSFEVGRKFRCSSCDLKLFFNAFLFVFQFYPTTTVLTVKSCELSTEEITITPTIPVVKTPRGLPKIMFWMPPDVVLADSQASCDIPLKEGTQSITVKIKAACKQGGVTEGLQPIIPVLSHKNSRFWHPGKVHLPTIWVCVF